jgi:DHA1 family bicyclomycin/chloramphenicol resistance-like MFS transporter
MVQQTLAVFFFGLAAGQVVYGPLSDRWGRRAPLFVGTVIYTLASIGCALAPALNSLIALRLAQALGGCAGMVISRSVVRDYFDRRESARMYSVLALVTGLAPILAPTLGGQLLVRFGWRAVFVVLTVYGIITVLLVRFALPESLPPERRVRAGLPAMLGNYAVLLADPYFLGFALTNALSYAAMFAYISASSFVFIELNGVRPERFGLYFGANAVGLLLAAQLNRMLLLRYGTLAILRGGLNVVIAGAAALTVVTVTGWGGFPGFLIALFITIASTGIVGPNAMAAAMAPYAANAGSASAMLGAIQFVVGAIASASVGWLHNGTALPMIGVVLLCATGSWLMLRLLALRHAAAYG